MNVTMNNKTVNCGNIGSPGDTARSLGRDFHKQIPSPPYGGGRANVNVNAEEKPSPFPQPLPKKQKVANDNQVRSYFSLF